MSDHKYTCPDCGRLYVCDEGDQDPPCCNREVLRAEIERLEAECMNLATHGRVYKRQYEQACQDHATAMAEITLLRALLRRYRTETPLGHQPHMIAHEVDAALAPQAASALPETAGRNADRSGDEIADRCEVCGQALTWEHDHKPDLSGLDDGPPLPGARSKPQPKSPDELRDIRARAWATRRQKHGPHGHR